MPQRRFPVKSVVLVGVAAYALAELFVLWRVGKAIGWMPMIGLLLLKGVLGLMMMRGLGLGTMKKASAGQAPSQSLGDGLLLFIGGLLLCTPGLIAGVVGASMLMAPVRRLCLRMAAGKVRDYVMGQARRVPGAVGPNDGTAGAGPFVFFKAWGVAPPPTASARKREDGPELIPPDGHSVRETEAIDVDFRRTD